MNKNFFSKLKDRVIKFCDPSSYEPFYPLPTKKGLRESDFRDSERKYTKNQ